MNEFIGGLLIACFVFFAGAGFTRWFHDEALVLGYEAKDLIQVCESELPRNQDCELHAKPIKPHSESAGGE